MKKINKSALVTAAAVAATALIPQVAVAHGSKSAAKSASSGSSVHSALETRLEQMEAELESLRAEVARTKSETSSQVQATEEKVTAKQAEVEERIEKQEEKNNMVFFRGGYADMVSGRSNQVFTDVYGKQNSLPVNNGRDGSYFGAGIDFSLSENLFGIMDDTQFLAEVNFDWKRWNSNDQSIRVVPTATGAIGASTNGTRGVTMSQFTLSASPKIKFLKGSPIRPWIIPVGMTFNVISPPSDAGTVLAPGAMFGLGADYNIWENLFVGLDARYNLVSHDLDGVKADHYMIGGYVGFGF